MTQIQLESFLTSLKFFRLDINVLWAIILFILDLIFISFLESSITQIRLQEGENILLLDQLKLDECIFLLTRYPLDQYS
jgi:hypothetical protein